MLLPETDLTGALVVAEKIRQVIATSPFIGHGLEIPLTVSIGVRASRSTADEQSAKGVTPHLLINLADQALYAAKAAGRNRVMSHESDLPATEA